MEYKKVYVAAHGMRIKDSYFALEPNVRVYTNCSDTMFFFTPFVTMLIMKYLLNKNSKISDYTNTIKIYSKYLNNIYKFRYETYDLIRKINEEIEYWLKRTDIYSKNKLKKIESEIQTIDKIIIKIGKKSNKKYKSMLIKLNKLKKVKKYKKKNIILYLKGNDEKLKTFNKSAYDKINRYKNLYNKYLKQKKYMDYVFQHQYGLKKNSLNYYNPAFNPCVFSGNLNNSIRKDIKNIVSKDLLDLHICPNVSISKEYNNNFRDFVTEFPINIEIRDNNNKIIVNKEGVEEVINKYIQKTLQKKKDNLINLYDNHLFTLDELMNNRILITLLMNFNKKYKRIARIKDKKYDKINSMKKELKDYVNKIEKIEEDVRNYETTYVNNIPIESDYDKIILKYRIYISSTNSELTKKRYKPEEKKRLIEEKDEYIKKNHLKITYIHNKKELKKIYIEKELKEKKIKDIEEQINKMRELHEKIEENKYIFYINKSENELFYPIDNWGDCNISTPFGIVLNEYIETYLKNYDLKNTKDEDILFRYYDIRKRRYLDVKECYKKHKKEYSYDKNEDKLRFNLRDLLIYLYNYYGLNKNPNLKLDVDISQLCLSEFIKPDKIYKVSRLNVNDYCKKLYKIDGKMMTLRDYDDNVLNNEEDKVKERRIKKSCSLYRVADGCPSHCDLPVNQKRRTCVVKGRKKEYIRKVKK